MHQKLEEEKLFVERENFSRDRKRENFPFLSDCGIEGDDKVISICFTPPIMTPSHQSFFLVSRYILFIPNKHLKFSIDLI